MITKNISKDIPYCHVIELQLETEKVIKIPHNYQIIKM